MYTDAFKQNRINSINNRTVFQKHKVVSIKLILEMEIDWRLLSIVIFKRFRLQAIFHHTFILYSL